MENLIDMHIHTYYSDGEFSPNEIIKKAIESGVSVMSITDHDNINGVKTIDRDLDFIKESGIIIFNGIEVNCHVSKGSMHVLGYDFDINNPKLNEWILEIKKNRNIVTLNVVKQVSMDYNIYFSDDDIEQMFDGKETIGRPDIARILIKKGLCKTVDEAFDLYLTPAREKIRGDNKRVLYSDCFNYIKDAGGLVVLAHPKTLLLNELELDSLIYEMKDYGLDGIEAYNSIHDEGDIEFYLNLARKYGLLVSGGSDYHGPNVKPGIEIGYGRNGNVHVKKLSLVDELRRRNNL